MKPSTSLIPFNTSPEVPTRIFSPSCFLPHIFQLIPTVLPNPRTLWLLDLPAPSFVISLLIILHHRGHISSFPSCYQTCHRFLIIAPSYSHEVLRLGINGKLLTTSPSRGLGRCFDGTDQYWVLCPTWRRF